MTARGHRNKTWIRIQEITKPVVEFDPTPAEWCDKYTVRAHVSTSQGDESVVGQRTDITRRTIISTRWLPGITEAMRVVIDDDTIHIEDEKRTLAISSIENVGQRNRDLEIGCTELSK